MKLDLEREFAENTTLHGISRVFQSAGVVLKLIWSFILLAAFALFVWQFSDRVSAYLKHDVNTLVEVELKPALTFPSVTLCNYNRFWASRLSDEHRKQLGPLLGYADNVGYYNYYSYNFFSSNEDQDFFHENDYFDFEQFAEKAGFLLNDSLIRCDWKGKKDSCSADNFTQVFIPEYGLCYTFGGNANSEVLYQNIPGSGGGLSLIIDIEQDDYTETFEQGHHEAGLKFVVHNKNDPPLVDTLGLAVPPGFHTYVAIRQSKFELLSKPWGKCETFSHNKTYGLHYSQKKCLIDCRRDFIVGECNCRPLGYDGEDNICTPDVAASCVGKALQKYRSYGSHGCSCPSSCTDISYKTTLSMTVFPSDKIVSEYVKESQSDDDIRKNVVYLDIFFDELSETKYKQIPAMTWSALLADLGGQMGLFMGMSVITGAEVIEYVIRRICSLFGMGRSTAVRDFNLK